MQLPQPSAFDRRDALAAEGAAVGGLAIAVLVALVYAGARRRSV